MYDDDEPEYRVMTRTRAVALLVAIAAPLALLVWLGMDWIEGYAERMDLLFERDPDAARAVLVRDVRIIAIVTAAFMLLMAGWLFRYGIRSLRTQAMPPAGSWVVEGQHTWTGAPAVRRAQLLLAGSAVILLLGLVAAAMMWRLPEALLGNI